MPTKKGFGGNPPMKRVTATRTGSGTKGVAKTGKARPAQFSPKTPGQRETGFTQRTPKQATAAMQGRAAPSGRGEADKGPRADAKKQFTKTGGRGVF